MKFNLIIRLMFLTIFSATIINSVNSQLKFGDSHEKDEGYIQIRGSVNGRQRQEDHRGEGDQQREQRASRLLQLLVGYGDQPQPQTRVGVDDGLLEPPRRGRGRVVEPSYRLPSSNNNKGSKVGKLAHLQIVPQSICVMKADPGFCNLIVGRWYYDHRYHRCLPFLYTGCGGNLNNFISMKKCTSATMHCHYINTAPLDALTKHALLNPLNPLGGLASDFILAG